MLVSSLYFERVLKMLSFKDSMGDSISGRLNLGEVDLP